MKHETLLAEIRRLISGDEISAALKILRGLLENTPQLNEILQQSGRLENIRRQMRIGIVSPADATLEQNRIRQGVLELLSEIEQQGAPPVVLGDLLDAVEKESTRPELRAEFERAVFIVNSKNVVVGSTISAGGDVHIGDRTIHTESRTSRRLRLFSVVFVPVLAGIGAFFWFQWKELQTPLVLKVRVENRTPNPELPEPEAQLLLTYGQKTETKTAVNGEALFEGIPANFREEQLRLQFSAEGFRPIDTTFSFDDELVVLAVRRNDDLATLSGIITDAASGQPLEGVSVSISCCQTLTDAAGQFTLQVPPEHQRLSQRLDIFKNGFEAKSVTTPVIPGETLRQGLIRH